MNCPLCGKPHPKNAPHDFTGADPVALQAMPWLGNIRATGTVSDAPAVQSVIRSNRRVPDGR